MDKLQHLRGKDKAKSKKKQHKHSDNRRHSRRR